MGITKVIKDDLDGAELAEDTKPVSVTFEGTEHPLYFSPENLARFQSFLAGNNPLLGKTTPSTPKTRAPGTLSDERVWLKDNGFPDIKAQGALSKAAKEALKNRPKAG